MKIKFGRFAPYLVMMLLSIAYVELQHYFHPAPVVQAVTTAADTLLGVDPAESACIPATQGCVTCYGGGYSFVCGCCGGLEDDVAIWCSGGCLSAVQIW